MIKNTKTPDVLNDTPYIYSVEHIVGPWHQYDFTLAVRGYGWEYVLSSAEYMIQADLCNIGTISITPFAGSQAKEYVSNFRENDENISLIAEFKNEASMLGVGGLSKALGGMPLKIVWINQTNIIRIMTPADDTEFMIRYMETVIRRNFGTADALKKGNTVVKLIEG